MAREHPLDRLRPADLPAPPEETLRVVRACADDDADSRTLGDLVARDPVLTAELLRIANSPFFALRAPVHTPAQAVTLIGQEALRNIALCLAVRDLLAPGAVPGLDLGRFWEAALRRALCARALGAGAGLDPEECFTLGLLQDVGLLGLLHLHPQWAGEWPRMEASDPEARLDQERNLFGVTHDRAGEVLARAWGLPGDLVAALGGHHAPELGDLSGRQRALCRVARAADWLAAVLSGDEPRRAFTRARALVEGEMDLPPGTVADILERTAGDLPAAGEAFGVPVGAQPDLEDLLRRAHLRLAEDNLGLQELTWQLEHALAERDRLAAELSRELALAREVQQSLLPPERPGVPGVHGINVAARQVSGDFFDAFPTRGGGRCFTIADVAGKGMNAALLMAKACSLLHCLGKAVADPAALAAMLNEEIAEKAVRGMFVTLVIGVLDPASGRGRLVNAGHLPVLQAGPAGGFRSLGAGGPPLGVVPEARFEAVPFDLKDGPLYLYTDGLTEAPRPDGRPLGIEGLQGLVRDHGDAPPGERIQRIAAAARQGAETLGDDLTLMVVERAP